MDLNRTQIASWPKLSWLAVLDTNQDSVQVMHGCGVECFDDWVCEAVWDGDFTDGDFDLTDIVYGSGLRLRDGKLKVISSGATVDRIQYIALDGRYYVSNSLVALLSVTGASVRPGYRGYHSDIVSVVQGIDNYKQCLVTDKGLVHFVYFNNLVWDGHVITTVPKPNAKRDFSSFDNYYEFLNESLRRLSINLADQRRASPFGQLATLSSGYDSTTVAALVSKYGCKEALSFDFARGNHEDTGAEAAEVLGLDLTVFERDKWQDDAFSEVMFLAADGHGEDRYFYAAGGMLENRVVFTGYHGDKVWDRDTEDKYICESLLRGDASGLSLSEYRLAVGFINCPIPFWGARQISDIVSISRSAEMSKWDTGNDYSRPICRRIAEPLGVRRESFGVKKKAASVLINTQPEFMTKRALMEYLDWLRRNRWDIVLQGRLPLIVSHRLDQFIYGGYVAMERFFIGFRNLLARVPGLWRLSNNRWLIDQGFLTMRIPAFYIRRFLFPWAIEQAKKSYPYPYQKTDKNQSSLPLCNEAAN